MCGLTGVFDARQPTTLAETALQMAGVLQHRGPDDSGVWCDEAAGIVLAHRRLSILDLSPAGHQPMVSASGRYIVAFNGEVYNHLDLRRLLEQDALAQVPAWRGHSDTETLLAAWEHWGLVGTLERTVGMYAMALWDRKDRTLTLARDRIGEKPLYYGWVGGSLVFGSELKALRAHSKFNNTVDRRALALLMRHNYVPAPWSIYEGIWKLRPGCYVQFSADSADSGSTPGNVKPFWSARDVAEQGLQRPFAGDLAAAVDQLETLLKTSIKGQMIADVPLGGFLSGGLDSSTVVALMQSQSSRPVRTFTIGFHEAAYNEAEHAKAVARHLGTDHNELYVTPAQTLDVIPKLPAMYDEPFSDSSQVPTFLVAQLARSQVTVALSGDGGDELFGGYNRYFWATELWRRFCRAPKGMRGLTARLLTTIPPASWNKLFGIVEPLLPSRLNYSNPGDKLHKLAGLLSATQPEAIYRQLISHWDDPSRLVVGADEPATVINDPSRWLHSPEFEHRMMFLDTVTYLPDDILVKVDRAAMAVSLETRVPMLDHRVVEFAWSLPLSFKIRDGKGKYLLRELLYKYVPRALIDRPKMGFGVPIDEWLRGPLRHWAEELLSEARLRREGYFHCGPIQEKWREHLSGRRNWQYLLWDVLMFQAWLDDVS